MPFRTPDFHVASVVARLSKIDGGPPYSVCALCEALGHNGLSQSLVTVRTADAGPEYEPDHTCVETIRVPGWHSNRLRLTWAPSFRKVLRDHCIAYSAGIIHNHGLWTYPNHVAAKVAHSLRIPLIVSAHGMLASWALRHKAWKKRWAWRLYQYNDLRHAHVFRATSDDEASAIRGLGFDQPIAVIPNGVEIPDLQKPISGRAQRILLFMGRIYPVKGLHNLIKAWAELRPKGWHCVIAGPSEAGHQREIMRAIRRSNLQADFSFPGRVDGKKKWDMFSSADLFVLPSFSENFGLVVAEALGCGVPVITTKGTPWRCVETVKCGWWVEPDPSSLATALGQAFGLNDETRREMGLRGRQFVLEKYSWPGIAKQVFALYNWVHGSCPKPDFVLNAMTR